MSSNSLFNLKYREDQFYIGANYILIKGENQLIKQNDFSSQIHFGFLRDFPLNKKGNWSIAMGLGPSYTQFQSNIDFKTGLISPSFNSAKYISLNLPFEIRWRTSTPENYKFWRIYFGIKTTYIFSSKFKHDSSIENYSLKSLPFNKVQSGFTLNVGNNTWNLGLYLGLTPLFNDKFIVKNTEFKNLKQFKLGLIFYIL